MFDPYLINQPAIIAFSGGRSSGYMLYRIIQAHGGKLPPDIHVVFCNTGKEMPETLDFVRDCGELFNVHINWLELASFGRVGVHEKGPHRGKSKFKATTKTVTYDTASRNGEPFDILIKGKGNLPNRVTRYCSYELKMRRCMDFSKTLPRKHTDYLRIVGIRGDEPRRASKLDGSVIDGIEHYLPMYRDRITKEDIHDFWKGRAGDLQLPNNNGCTDFGNCDLCFMKSYKKRLSIMRERPDLARWWIEKEEQASLYTSGTANRFTNDKPSYEQMQIIATDNHAFDFGDDESLPCFCSD